jgi:hypothetical protein
MEKRMNARRLIGRASTLAVMFLLAVSAPGAAQTTTSTTSTTTELTGNIPATCAGEVIPASGTFHVVMHMTETPSGMTSSVFHINLHGSGVGEDTGLQYQWMQTTTTVFNFRGDSSAGPTEFTSDIFVHVISEGNENDFFRHSHVHTTINALGEMTAHTDFFERECR